MTENRLLKYFLVAAQEENITKAAEILHVSQPVLSKQIMQLEEELGAKLFIRGKRSLTLTEEGRFLRGRAQEIVALTEKTERDFRDEGLLIEPAVDLSKYDFLRIPVQDRWGVPVSADNPLFGKDTVSTESWLRKSGVEIAGQGTP